MKETMPAVPVVPVERHFEQEGFGNRKLIRPFINHTNHPAVNHAPGHSAAGIGERRERPERGDRSNGARKSAPPEQTNAENFYFQKQMQSKTPMIIVLLDDEEVHGIIEWYDKTCIKVNRVGAPNLMIYKPSIKYMYKEDEGRK